ncbi:MAG: DUF424 family protein [Candidatus Pacearchaeota archaeon]|nr:MAG: DUF424 family protein [Candidatus Pacearchaeota archaeon]
MPKILVKIHQAYREVISICDSDLIGKRFEEGNMQLEVSEQFYKGEEMSKDKVIELLKEKSQENACFNFVGKQAIETGIKAEIVDEGRVIEIQGVPHAMALL